MRVDLLTSCAKVLREATGFKPQFLVGLGQGGLVAAVLRWAWSWSSRSRPRAAADVDMGDEMTEAAAAEPDLTIGELVDKTTDKLTFMGKMEARMVNMEAALSSRAGAEHSDVLAKAERLLHKAEEYLEQRDAEAGAAASGAPSSKIAAPDQDARLLEGIGSQG